jgi:AP endonuclease-1
LSTFAHILRDPRTQGIPLVVETPNFDDDRAVWTGEVRVLNALSEHRSPPLSEVSEAGTSTHGKNSAINEWMKELTVAVEDAKQRKEAKEVIKTTGREKRKRKQAVHNEHEEDTDTGNPAAVRDHPDEMISRRRGKRPDIAAVKSAEGSDLSDLTESEEG